MDGYQLVQMHHLDRPRQPGQVTRMKTVRPRHAVLVEIGRSGCPGQDEIGRTRCADQEDLDRSKHTRWVETGQSGHAGQTETSRPRRAGQLEGLVQPREGHVRCTPTEDSTTRRPIVPSEHRHHRRATRRCLGALRIKEDGLLVMAE